VIVPGLDNVPPTATVPAPELIEALPAL